MKKLEKIILINKTMIKIIKILIWVNPWIYLIVLNKYNHK